MGEIDFRFMPETTFDPVTLFVDEFAFRLIVDFGSDVKPFVRILCV